MSNGRSWLKWVGIGCGGALVLLVSTQAAGADRWAAGSVLPLFVITIAAAETVVALAVVLTAFRQRSRIDLDEPSGEAP